MPYVFGFLVVVNIAFFGYSWFFPKEHNGTLDTVKASLKKPLDFQNNTANIPPLVGDK